MDLKLERKNEIDRTGHIGPAVISPLIDEDYWEYRVIVGEHQAVLGFPKVGTIGIGFAVENGSWNTNLPYSFPAAQILKHISINKGDKTISDEDYLAAIKLIQAAVKKDRKS